MKKIYAEKIKDAKGEIENAENLLKEKELQIGLRERATTKLKGFSHIVLDFGKEISGGVRILTYRVKGNKRVRLRFGESLTESCAEIGEKNATNDHALRDMTVELQDLSDMKFGDTGFRFFRIDTLSEDTGLELKSIVAEIEETEREASGKFESNDELLNEIWETAAYTLKLCLRNGYFWDGVKRDRLVWIGDLYPEMKAAQSLYKEIPEIENSLRNARNQAEKGEWINNIPMYSMWWLIVLGEYYKYSGAERFVREELPYIKELIKQLGSYVDEEGETKFEYNFIDWPTHYEEGEPEEKKWDEYIGINYLLRIALNKTGGMLKEIGEGDSDAEEVLKRLCKKSYKVKRYKQIAALGVWSGERTAHNREVLLNGGAEGVSTFMSYEILTALGEYGEYEKALEILKDYYGGMLRLGATTFWEDFDVKWQEGASRIDEFPKEGEKDIHGDYGAFCYKGFRHSLCHGWSAGVLSYLSETVLGLKPEGTGFRRIRFEPKPWGLEYAKGILPTPYGEIEAEWHMTKEGKLEKKILRAPKEIEIVG